MNGIAPTAPLVGILTDPTKQVTFSFDGQAITAVAGQSIAAALYEAGVRVFTRSFKYHRPRGLFCVSGDCPNCLMQVDGKPNVRTCIEPAHEGQVVCHQNAWPSLDFDVLRVFDKLDRFLPVGFYYKQFHKPRWLWPIFEHTVRHIAGLGRIDVNAVPDAETDIEYLHTEACVVGGGPAGLAAAEAAAGAGASVLLIDRQSRLGGHMLGVLGTSSSNEEASQVEQLLASLSVNPQIRILCNTTVFGLYEGNLLGAFQKARLLKIRAKQIIVCTGGRERPFVFHNNDLPGIWLGRGVLRLAQLYGVRAGQRAVVLTDNDEGLLLARQLMSLGMAVAAVVDRRFSWDTHANEIRTALGGLILAGSTVVSARGSSHLRAVQVAVVRPDGTIDAHSTKEIPCDLLCMAPMPVPTNELLLQGGVRYRFEDGGWSPDRFSPGLHAAGAVAGTQDVRTHILQGRLRGAEAATVLGYSVPNLEEYRQGWEDAQTRRRGDAGTVTASPRHCVPASLSAGHKRFICLCEDVTEKDLDQAIAEGFDNIETLKRYSTANMGPCQGKICGLLAAEVCAHATGRDLNAIGMTTSRPPAVPVELAVLAAGSHHPVRRTPLDHWHKVAGAKWMDAGQWKRPESYGDPMSEVQAVRTGVGLIDVSTLGKIELVGPDAAELLERIYLNRWSDLKVGRVRYGVMCDEDGILFDDGVGVRLGPERFYLTATTGNAEGVFQWLELWKTTWRLNVTILNHASAVAAMNLAGPRSRDVLARLTAVNVSSAAFPYMAMREADVAGVHCRLFRIGFVGELGYEIHCPSAQAWHLWEALCEAGREFDLKPFGVEAQRILRLEKGHLIIGVDTDALSSPLEAGLEGMVRFDKPMFHGREPLERLKARGPRSRLVGFFMEDCNLVPDEGCQVVDRGHPVGRVTSSRYSPTIRRSLGLAWVPVANSSVGNRFFTRCNGLDSSATVASLPFYDPDAKRLKM